MNLTNTQRIGKLIGGLIRYPRLLPCYIKHNCIARQKPIDIGLPWWSYLAIEYVDQIVDNKVIFEYGTGGSTLRYARKAKTIISVEDDPIWFSAIKNKLKEENINNVELLLRPFDFKNPEGFSDSDYLNALSSNKYDIIIIDGQDYTFEERVKCYFHAERFVKSGSFIIVDDFWRYENIKKKSKAKEILVFESVGPCRYGVTSTAVFLF